MTKDLASQKVREEFKRLDSAINDGSFREQHNKLYAARQALAWALQPEAYRSPYDSIMGNQPTSANCQAEHRPPRF